MTKTSLTRRSFLASSAAAPVILTTACEKMTDATDTIYFNGKILTLDNADSVAEAVAIKDGRILAVGADRDVLTFAGPDTERIDLQGKTVLPGLIEGHAHPENASLSERDAPLPNPRTVGECLAWVRDQAVLTTPGEWIVHPKLFPTRLKEMRPPSLSELDHAAPDNPVFLNASYGAVVNSAAFRVSGISDKTEHPGLLRNPSTGKLNGKLIHTAFKLLKRPASEKISTDEHVGYIREMHRRYNSVGFTTVVSGGLRTDAISVYDALRESGPPTVRVIVNIYAPFSVPGTPPDEMKKKLDDIGFSSGDGDDWLRIGSLKTTVDGGILTGTAYMREPWGETAREVYGIQETGYRGIPRMSADEYADFVRTANDAGWRTTAHCTGGGGVDLMLDAYETVSAEREITPGSFTIIHGNFYTPDAMRRAAHLGVTAESQPAWFYKDADAMRYILGDSRIRTFHPYRSMIDNGVLVSAGSDHMVILDDREAINPYSPWVAMGAMITRTTERGSVIVKEEAISRLEALCCYTVNNARAYFEEDIKGSIEPGKYADMIVIDRDYLACPEEEIEGIEVVKTIVDGKVVFEGKVQRS